MPRGEKGSSFMSGFSKLFSDRTVKNTRFQIIDDFSALKRISKSVFIEFLGRVYFYGTLKSPWLMGRMS